MAEARLKKERNPNFTQTDCLLLCEIMGRASTVSNHTNNDVYRSKSVPWITAKIKKEVWQNVANLYNEQAVHPRSHSDLTKKWDNLVQTHRAKYVDYKRDFSRTAGGKKDALSPVTEAVMDVIGRDAVNVLGVLPASSGLDTTWLQINHGTGTPSSTASTEVVENNTTQSSSGSTCMNTASTSSSDCSLPTTFHMETVQPVLNVQSSQHCNCNLCTEILTLKKRKLQLEVDILEKKSKTC